jgi:hypothetical protein
MAQDVRQRYVDLLLAWSEDQYDYVHPNAAINHVPSIPYGGTKRGPVGIKSIIDGLAANFEVEQDRIETVLVGDDKVMLQFWVHFVNKRSGRREPLAVVEIYRFEDGLCVEQDIYYRTPEVVVDMLDEAGYVEP